MTLISKLSRGKRPDVKVQYANILHIPIYAHILHFKKSKLHGITTRKIILFILTNMRTSNSTTFNWAK
jgi:hypothetical protein